MTMNQEATQIIANALAQLGLQVPSPMTENLSITLKDQTVLRIDVVDSGKRVVVWNELLRWPRPEEEAELLENLLRMHAFGTATQGAAFTANREAGSVVVFKSFPSHRLSADWLAEELESLVALIAQIQAMGKAGQLGGDAAAGQASVGGTPSFA
ncbi:type III secretion system chaperone [Parachitinimonas caeni]|uniref:Type III secretion system chaperone n=1 Tax=Parachitinimonas caeni TaxID=3031301 RepID=A0ABT7E315_9NEIS|nr:type III secretion system chaperone [Parachitinimonas caeni]MDK2125785.1 type III secretion system chaperone [Parachitinimonas caeni]